MGLFLIGVELRRVSEGICMNFNYDHDRFVSKNRSTANAYDVDKKDKSLEQKGYSHLQRQADASCSNCKMSKKCPEFRAKRGGGTAGVVSVGGGETMICDKYVPAPAESRGMSHSQIKSLLKNASRGHI
jgi:hypothetical protein